MRRVVISSAHGLKVAGASGVIGEVAESRRVVPRVAAFLRQAGVETIEFNENNATTQSANVSAIIAYHNSQSRDLDVSVHFNHSGGGIVERAIGTETLFATQKDLAARVSQAIAEAGKLINRNAKLRNDLAFLTRTTKPAILIEICFVNSREDVRLYQAGFEPICRRIAEAITGKSIPVSPPEPPPIVPPQRPVITVSAPPNVEIKVIQNV